MFANVALGRIGARFALAYPEVQLEIVAEDRLVDPVEDGYDLVLRIDPAPDARLVGRRFLTDERLIVASPSLPLPGSPGRAPSEIPVDAVVLSAMPKDGVWRMRSADAGAVVLRPKPILRLSSLLMVRDAVLAGAGVGLLPKLFVADDLAAGRLAHWGVEDGPPVQIWALQSSGRLVGAKVRAFLEVVDQSFPSKVFAPQS